MSKPLVAIIGGHSANTSPEAITIAEQVGFELARRGFGVVCGGYTGIMEAACRGCKAGGGTTVAILKHNATGHENRYIDYAIPTSMDVACNNIIVWTASGLIAFEGRYGTLNEMALALDFGKPLVVVGRSPLLNMSTITSDNFRHVPTHDPGRAPEIVDVLEELMAGVVK
jgi:uncharacterized protein (TIGR00725 family)